MDKVKILQKIVFFATGLALLVIALGAYTRLTDAGLGCPDWPGCYGDLIQNQNNMWTRQAWTEMIHRYIAGTLGLLVLCIVGIAFTYRKILPHKIPFILLGLIVFQALLGMWTVTLKLHPSIVTLHLVGGFSTLSLLWLYFLQLRERHVITKASPSSPLFWILLIALTCLLLQILLGAWTSSNYAALACLDFPQCQQSWLPQSNFKEAFIFWHPIGPNFEYGLLDNSSRMTIHMVHRFWAMITAGVITLACGLLLRQSPDSSMRRVIYSVIVLLCVQLSLGITNVIAVLPLGIAVLHNIFAALLLLSLVTLTYSVARGHYATR